jgi:hypothetical protein
VDTFGDVQDVKVGEGQVHLAVSGTPIYLTEE